MRWEATQKDTGFEASLVTAEGRVMDVIWRATCEKLENAMQVTAKTDGHIPVTWI